jgi:hypothetical protein
MKFSIIFILIAIIFYLINLYTSYSENTYIKSTVDNNTYIIRNSHNKSVEFLQNSANTLASINIKMETLINYLVKKYAQDTNNNYWVNKLRENYKPYMVSEAANDPRYTTYTIDKTDMRVCLRTRDSKEDLYDLNLLMYVVLHESAHMGNYSPDGIPIIGHGIEFKNIFIILVKEAIQLGLYKYEDYSKNPKSYCGLVLSSQIIG